MWRWLGLFWLSMLGTVGCSNDRSPDKMYERLLDRLANVTEVEVTETAKAPPLPAYPRPRDLALPVDDVRVGFGTFHGLGRCGLLGEVSARNNSLGKFQSITARLLYEQRFYRQLQGCMDRMRQASPPDEDFLKEAQAIATRKRENLPATFWNATFASPEFRTLMNTVADPLARDADPVTADITGALEFITQIGMSLDSVSVDSQTFEIGPLEAHYFKLQSGKLVGPLLQGMRVSLDYLRRGSRLLQTVADQNRLCPMGKKTKRGEYLFNVFQKYYIGEAQPYLSLLHTRARPVFERLQDLLKAQRAPVPPAFGDFYNKTLNPDLGSSLWAEFNEEIAQHTRAWQKVLRQCDLMPKPAEG